MLKLTNKQLKSKNSLKIKTIIQSYIDELKQSLDMLDFGKIDEAIRIIIQAYRRQKKIFIMGNGGSAATASHMACDLGKGTLRRVYDESEPRLKVYSLTDNVAALTAYANDLSFEDVFVQQLRNLLEKDDVVIVLSGSGNSKNIIKAINYAKKCRSKTIGILGFQDGGKAGRLVDLAIIIDSNKYGVCEDITLILNHIFISLLAELR